MFGVRSLSDGNALPQRAKGNVRFQAKGTRHITSALA